MNRLASAFVLGYHACDQSVVDKVLLGSPFTPSKQKHDWLGHGVYFWEANPERGLEWAQEHRAVRKPAVKTPAVIGAVIDLGRCLDLTTKRSLDLLVPAYEELLSPSPEPCRITAKGKCAEISIARSSIGSILFS